MAIKVTTGLVNRPQKVVIYGSEGVGKTTLASDFPSPLFIDTEGGTAHMNVARAQWGETWTDLISTVKEVAKSKDLCETLVIDTADWAEQLCIKHVLKTRLINGNPASGVEDYGYGKGYTYVGEEFQNLLSALNDVIQNGIHVVVTAHAKMRKFEQPDETGAYDRWEMKLSKQVSPLLKEWADMILFCNYQTRVVTTENKVKKAQGGKRIMFTTHHPCWDAKNRHGLPDKLDMEYARIKDAIEGGAKDTRPEPDAAPKKSQPKKPEPAKKETPDLAPAKTPLEQLQEKMKEVLISAENVQDACSMAKLQPKNKPLEEYGDEFIQKQLLDKWDKFHVFVLKKVIGVPEEWFDEKQGG